MEINENKVYEAIEKIKKNYDEGDSSVHKEEIDKVVNWAKNGDLAVTKINEVHTHNFEQVMTTIGRLVKDTYWSHVRNKVNNIESDIILKLKLIVKIDDSDSINTLTTVTHERHYTIKFSNFDNLLGGFVLNSDYEPLLSTGMVTGATYDEMCNEVKFSNKIFEDVNEIVESLLDCEDVTYSQLILSTMRSFRI